MCLPLTCCILIVIAGYLVVGDWAIKGIDRRAWLASSCTNLSYSLYIEDCLGNVCRGVRSTGYFLGGF